MTMRKHAVALWEALGEDVDDICEGCIQNIESALLAAEQRALREAADLAGNSAATIRSLAQGYIASPVSAELAIVHAEALEEFAKGLRNWADSLSLLIRDGETKQP